MVSSLSLAGRNLQTMDSSNSLRRVKNDEGCLIYSRCLLSDIIRINLLCLHLGGFKLNQRRDLNQRAPYNIIRRNKRWYEQAPQSQDTQPKETQKHSKSQRVICSTLMSASALLKRAKTLSQNRDASWPSTPLKVSEEGEPASDSAPAPLPNSAFQSRPHSNSST